MSLLARPLLARTWVRTIRDVAVALFPIAIVLAASALPGSAMRPAAAAASFHPKCDDAIVQSILSPHTSITDEPPPRFRWPLKGKIMSTFGSARKGYEVDGISLSAKEGSSVRAAKDGIVVYSGSELKHYGNLVLLRHADHYITAYANLKDILVSRGDCVRSGQVIATSGHTGNVPSSRLYFEIRRGSTPVDPLKYLTDLAK